MKTGPSSSQSTGREQLVNNVVGSWMAQIVMVIAGFLMPRMIDQRLGQEMLGVWDFAWSIVGYFALIQLGIAGSVNRYVAMYRAKGDIPAVNRCVSSVLAVLLTMCAIMAVATVAVSLYAPHLMGVKGSAHHTEVAWAILFLGLSTAAQTAASAHTGVITGCHKFSLHNGLTAGSYALTVAGMITVLLLGGQIRSLAIIYFCGEAFQGIARMVVASKVCPGLKVRLTYADWKTARGMLRFGGKAFIPQISDLFLNQTVNVLIAGSFGPAALALYARPRSLIMQLNTVIFKMAGVILPSVSSLHVLGQHEKIQDLLIKGGRYASFLALPAIIAMGIMGGPIMRLWMGPQYANAWLMVIFAVGYASCIIQVPTFAILGGMDMHGRVALARFFTSIFTLVVVAILVLGLKTSVEWVALASAAPIGLLYATYVPWHACRRLDLSFRRYTKEAFLEPLAMLTPFAVCLIAVRLLFPSEPMLALAIASVAGALILAPIYWFKVLPASLKNKLNRAETGSPNAAEEALTARPQL